MNRTRVDAIVQAIVEPDIRTQEEIRRKHSAEDLLMTQKRQVAWLMLIGGATGSVAACSMDVRFTEGIIWGGITGSALGWLFVWLRNKSRAT